MEDSFEYSEEIVEEIRVKNDINDNIKTITADVSKDVNCYCEGHCPFGDEKGTCTLKPGGKCFTSVEATMYDDGFEYPVFTYGCLPANEMALLQCKGVLVPHELSKSIHCCDHADYCNKNLLPLYEIKETTPNSDILSDRIPFIILISSLGCCFVILGLVITVVWIQYKRRLNDKRTERKEEEEDTAMENDVTINLANLMEVTEVERSNLNNMVQATIAQQVDLKKSVGKGQYGEVWLARWRDEHVAVKIFHKAHVHSWYNEIRIYQTVLMRHENILGFVAADVKGSGIWTQPMLITEYHESGSLYHYLLTHTLDTSTLLSMACSIAKGLAHLHTEVCGFHGKPSIAHRNLQSKNILVKNSGECCISDFGLAVKYIRIDNQVVMPKGKRQASVRYMAPEVLNGSINVNIFEHHEKTDMYALGLVLWEMSKRCEVGDFPVLEYEKPFHDIVSDDISVEDMREIVCTQKIRPDIPEEWRNVGLLNTVAKLIQELWHDNPSARLTSLRVKKTLLEYKLEN